MINLHLEKKGTAMDYKVYHNCLRIQITNDGMQDERIEKYRKSL